MYYCKSTRDDVVWWTRVERPVSVTVRYRLMVRLSCELSAGLCSCAGICAHMTVHAWLTAHAWLHMHDWLCMVHILHLFAHSHSMMRNWLWKVCHTFYVLCTFYSLLGYARIFVVTPRPSEKKRKKKYKHYFSFPRPSEGKITHFSTKHCEKYVVHIYNYTWT